MQFENSMQQGEIIAYSYMVERGKPAAMLPIHERDVENAVVFVRETFNLNTYIEDLAEGWKTLWIYKHEHILSIIRILPRVPKTIFDHWTLGKLFGYEESAIHEFISVKFS